MQEAGPQSAPAELAKQAAPEERQASPALQDSAASRAAPPAASVPAPAAAAGATPQRRAVAAESFVAPSWTHLRLEGAGKSVTVARSEAPLLARDLDQAQRAVGTQPFAEDVEVRVQVLEGARLLGTLTVGRTQLGWAPTGATGAPRLVIADTGLVQSLRSELERLLR